MFAARRLVSNVGKIHMPITGSCTIDENQWRELKITHCHNHEALHESTVFSWYPLFLMYTFHSRDAQESYLFEIRLLVQQI
jgi:hypothetical protein